MNNQIIPADSIIPFETSNKNNYVLIKKGEFKYLMYVHPEFITQLNSQRNNNTDNYYSKKIDYIKNKLPKNGYSFSGRVHAEQIKDACCNTNQIVFEVTDTCNLNCLYCNYGEIYEDHDERENNILTKEKVLPFLEYISNLWKEKSNQSINNTIYISFYGGEPLLNMPFIKDIVNYIKNNIKQDHRFVFSMTTNGVLLNQHIDYLIENEFRLLISLDGNIENNGYRIDRKGKESFSKIIKNIDDLRKNHLGYFERCINFNAVLHNKNSVEEIYNFIYNKYNKIPHIGELNNSGVRKNQKERYLKMYNNLNQSIKKYKDYHLLEKNIFMESPDYSKANIFLHSYHIGVFKNYNDFYRNKPLKYVPTGTCMPFIRKIFITSKGKILPCERIGHQFSLGEIKNGKLNLNYEQIAQTYNNYYNKLEKLCSNCFRAEVCQQCIFNIDTINKENVICYGFTNNKGMKEYLSDIFNFFETHPKDYFRIMKEAVVK